MIRQDQAFFDIYDVGGIALEIGTHASKFRRALGRKFGEFIHYLTQGLGGVAVALYLSWKVALLIMAGLPVTVLCGALIIRINQRQSVRSAQGYREAGSIAYSAVSSIRTVLSLNAVTAFVQRYKAATLKAFREATSILFYLGLARGGC